MARRWADSTTSGWAAATAASKMARRRGRLSVMVSQKTRSEDLRPQEAERLSIRSRQKKTPAKRGLWRFASIVCWSATGERLDSSLVDAVHRLLGLRVRSALGVEFAHPLQHGTLGVCADTDGRVIVYNRQRPGQDRVAVGAIGVVPLLQRLDDGAAAFHGECALLAIRTEDAFLDCRMPVGDAAKVSHFLP